MMTEGRFDLVIFDCDRVLVAIGFCGGSHCGPRQVDRLKAGGAVFAIADMRELANTISRLPQLG